MVQTLAFASNGGIFTSERCGSSTGCVKGVLLALVLLVRNLTVAAAGTGAACPRCTGLGGC